LVVWQQFRRQLSAHHTAARLLWSGGVAGKGQGAFVLLLQNQLQAWWQVGWQNRVWFVSCSKGTHVHHGRQELMSKRLSDIVCVFMVSKNNNRARVLTWRHHAGDPGAAIVTC
jgi:hypothetical protein